MISSSGSVELKGRRIRKGFDVIGKVVLMKTNITRNKEFLGCYIIEFIAFLTIRIANKDTRDSSSMELGPALFKSGSKAKATEKT